MLLKLTRTSILLFFFCFTQSAIQAQEQLAIWTFPALSGISDGTQIFPTTDDVDGTPFLQQFNQDIDDNGTSGIAYTDQEGVMHPANDAIEWDDIKGSGADATLEITINTTGWEDIYLRFDYKSESANSFDLEYSVNGAAFIKPFNNESIIADADLNTWYSKTLNLTSENLLENATSVLIRINDFDRNGNDKLDLDNIELYGTKIAAPTGTPDLTVAATTTPFLSLSADGPGFVSGVIGDAADPAATFGIDFLLEDSDTPIADLSFSATSSNTAVVANSNLSITGINDARNLKITPSGVGYTTITVTLSDLDGNSDDYVIEYAASAALPPTSICHTGKSDASTAVAIDADYMFVADDEDEIIRLYDRDQPGLPLNSFNFAGNLDKDGTREVDLEASIKVGNTIYWLGSHSNNSDGELRPNRSRLFSTTISGSGANATLSFGDFYKFLKDDLVAWDAGNGHGLGANFLNFTAATMDGVVPETTNGFNIEGLALAPGSTTTAFLGFRAPVPGDAIIVPVTNFTSLPGNAGAGAATFGAPIFLDLGGRGIRSIARNASDEYIIVAGPAGSAGAAPNNFQLFYWDGNAASSPEEIIATPALNTGISFESLVEVPNPLADGVQVQMLADNGDTDWYDDGMRSKDLAQLNFQKFCSGIFTLDVPTCDIAISGVAATDETCAGDVDGTITITATCTSCTSIQYSIDGGSTFQANNTFSGLPPDNYDIVVKDMGDASCTASTMETVNFGAPLPADPVAIQMSAEFCSNSGVGNGQKRVRIEAPSGANEGTIWTLTDAPTGSQFDGMEPIEFAEGETNSEFRITGGSKGNTVTMRGEP
ncbi:MAG: DUF3616 domain-containing protein, partial [Saprospiraceae bacterium]|nr:DUF3616 domain-containing protein [Saprospiraceae bacterium]